MISEINAYLKHLVEEKNLKYLDVACMQNHKLKYRGLFGKNVNGRERLYMYSCSKPVTVTAFGKLYDEGAISLSEPVKNFIPEFADITLQDGTRCQTEMTVKHLLTMTAGFDYNYKPDSVLKLLRKNANAGTLDIVKAYAKAPLQFNPGERFNYSLCHDVLAAVIEVASGVKFSEFVDRNIFKPLCMNASTFNNISFDGLADVYSSNDMEKPVQGFVPTTHYYESGGSGLISTVEDYLRFADMLACSGVSAEGCRILSENTLKMITTEQISSITVNNNFTCVQGDDYGYGLGMRVRTADTDWGLNKGEFGWDGAAGSYLLVDPEKKVSIVIGMHLLGWPKIFKGEHLKIVKEIYKNVLGE